MALQGSGQIKLSEIATEFNDSAPHAMSEFYDAASGVPASGELQLAADFYGVANYQAIVATGGSVTTSGDYKFHTFTSSGTFAVTTAAAGAATATADYVCVAGGGPGGAKPCGGGGAGGMLAGTMTPSVQNYTITIGGGGSGSSAVGASSTAGGAGNGGSGGSGGARGGGAASPSGRGVYGYKVQEY